MSEPSEPRTIIEHDLPGQSGLRIGNYELLTKIAAGGMGEVFIACSQQEPERRVALKLLLPHLSSNVEFVRMFLDEARIAARMNHPNIVPILDLGQAGGRYYLAMALIEGVSLKVLLSECRKRGLQLPLPIVERIADGLCSGLEYAHRLKGASGQSFEVIHRDVTPHNVLLSVKGDVLLTDFGIAKAEGNLHHTRAGTVRGKYAYLAPEQLQPETKIDQRADLFSAAVTLYETFTLLSPFSRTTEIEVVEALRGCVVPDATSIRPQVDSEVSAAFQRATQREPSKRFGSARELRDALVRGPPSGGDQLGAWVENLCGVNLKPFHGLPPLETIVDQPTRSMAEGPQPAMPAAPTTKALDQEPSSFSAPQLKTEVLQARQPIVPMLVLGLALGLFVTSGALWVAMRSFRTPTVSSEPALSEPPVGYLAADGDPAAEVSVDGRVIERSSVARYPLAVGKHRVIFRNPVSGKITSRNVEILEGQIARVQVTFDP